jgi:hypothetical protein
MPAHALKPKRLNYGRRAVLFLMMTILLACPPLQAQASDFDNRSWQLLNSAPGVTTDYSTTFTISTNTTIGSLSVLLCSNDPLQNDSCTLPVGLDVTNAQLSYQSGITDFSLFPAATNELILSHTPVLPVLTSCV